MNFMLHAPFELGPSWASMKRLTFKLTLMNWPNTNKLSAVRGSINDQSADYHQRTNALYEYEQAP